jgi:hypothetical protein
MQESKNKYWVVEKRLEDAKKRGVNYQYPIKPEQILKMPRFTDSEFRNHPHLDAYKVWNKDPNTKKVRPKGFYIQQFEKLFAAIADEIYNEIEENLHGVKLPFELGDIYVGTPPMKTFYTMIGKSNHKHIIWRNGNKYCNKLLKYFFFKTYKRNYKSAIQREQYYTTAKERIPHYSKLI